MSRLAYLDCANGASGDMLLGALVDVGLSLEQLRAELAKLPLRGYHLEAHRVHRSGLHATKVDVRVEGHSHSHEHRGLSDILGLLEKSGLEPAVKERCASLFRRLAEAEGAVHGVPAEAIHFHEVGAVDSIVDVVGGVLGLSWLRADRIVSSALNLGTGSVTMSHGTFAVPAPATARLVQGVPVYGAGDGELLTPTGALLVTGHAEAYGPLPLLRPQAIGHGAGSRDTPGRPNVLRLIVGEADSDAAAETVLVLETEVDDTAPQLLGALLDRLLAAGALDVYYTPIHMKKGRPGILITVLSPPERREGLEEILFAETTTLGVRRQEWARSVLDRDVVPVATVYGAVRVKVGRRGGKVYNVQPEFEDCQQAAAASGVPAQGGVERGPRGLSGAAREPAAPPHHTDLLRQRRAARGPRLHHDRRGHGHPRPPPARGRRVPPDRHRRARPEHRAHRPREGDTDAAVLRRDLEPVSGRLEEPRHPLRRLHPHHRGAPHAGRARLWSKLCERHHPRRPPRRSIKESTRAGTALAVRPSMTRRS